jgi:2-polyprenyl-3-methyl-5-hydroxy-6-metoxy-1,4-benzoquinol methylase
VKSSCPIDPALLTPAELASIGRKVGAALPLKERLLMRYRPHICPFHKLVPHVPQGAQVLDVGCGNGFWLLLLAELGRISHGLGTEISQKKIDTATALASRHPALRFVYRQPEKPWPDDECDCLTMIDVLHHVPPEAQLSFLDRIAATRVRTVVFKDIDPADVPRRMMNTIHDVVLSRQIPRYCPPETVAVHLRKLGFEIQVRQKINMLWYGHYLIVAARG